jgi:hypothetical protein
MRRFALLIALVIGLSACSGARTRETFLAEAPYDVPSGSIVLRVQVLSVEFTGWYAACPDEDCIPFHFWTKYRARVKDVISGEWSKSEVLFTHLQHAQYIDEVTKDCYVVILPADADLMEKVGVSYVADRMLSRYFKEDRAAIRALRAGT